MDFNLVKSQLTYGKAKSLPFPGAQGLGQAFLYWFIHISLCNPYWHVTWECSPTLAFQML